MDVRLPVARALQLRLHQRGRARRLAGGLRHSQIAPEFDWRDAEWLLGEWNAPSAVKGVCRPDDAVKAVETGFTTRWVSNHGARQLETSPATIDVLPSIRAAVGPDVEIIMDGGVQRGTDICKALALGADSVGVGERHPRAVPPAPPPRRPRRGRP